MKTIKVEVTEADIRAKLGECGLPTALCCPVTRGICRAIGADISHRRVRTFPRVIRVDDSQIGVPSDVRAFVGAYDSAVSRSGIDELPPDIPLVGPLAPFSFTLEVPE